MYKEIRIGLIVPSSNTTMEYEFRKMLPPKISLHTARMRLTNVTIEELFKMEKDAISAGLMLADADVDIIVYGCTTGSLVGGKGYDEKIAQEIKKATNKNVVVTATAVVDALKELHTLKISLATPYTNEVTEKEINFLEDMGLKILNSKNLGITSNLEIGRQRLETVYQLAKQANVNQAEAIFISCTNLRTIEIIDQLENELKKPVISSNTATLWATLRKLGFRKKFRKYGTLLKEYL
jgi:maleate isomerase